MAELFIGANGIVVDQHRGITPGGKSEGDESPWETALRETKEEPGNSLPKQVTRAADAARYSGKPLFRFQDGPPSRELLKLICNSA